MKRLLSTGDIDAVFGNADDQCGDNDNALYTQIRTRQHKKSKKASSSAVSTRQSVTVFGVVSCPGKSGQSTTDAVATADGASDPSISELQSTVEQLTAVVYAQKNNHRQLDSQTKFRFVIFGYS